MNQLKDKVETDLTDLPVTPAGAEDTKAGDSQRVQASQSVFSVRVRSTDSN